MRHVERNEVLGLADYEAIRDRFRARVIEEKKRRRIPLGPRATVIFENRDTVLMQIQEMLRTERITKEAAIRHEIETYNALVPGDRELSATLFIEIDDKAERDAFLVAARGLTFQLAFSAAGERFPAVSMEAREHEDRTSAVHYLKFPLSEAGIRALVAAGGTSGAGGDAPGCALVVDHPAYTARTELPKIVLASLAEDFEG